MSGHLLHRNQETKKEPQQHVPPVHHVKQSNTRPHPDAVKETLGESPNGVHDDVTMVDAQRIEEQRAMLDEEGWVDQGHEEGVLDEFLEVDVAPSDWVGVVERAHLSPETPISHHCYGTCVIQTTSKEDKNNLN